MRGRSVKTAIVTEWVSFTPTTSFTTNVTWTGLWRRVGNMMEMRATAAFSGATDAVQLTLNLPTGYSLDTSKLGSSVVIGIDGFGVAYDFGGNVFQFRMYYNSSTLYVVYQSATSGATTIVTNATPLAWGASDEMSLFLRVPILGWKATRNI